MTFTLIAVDREHGLLGAATASRSLAVGNAVIAVDPAVGVVASQAWTNRALRHLMLEVMAAGASAQDAVDRVPGWDDQPGLRQVGALNLRGGIAAATGSQTSAWAGHSVARDHAVLGNVLVGPEVLDAMSRSFASGQGIDGVDPETSLGFAARLLAALDAGDRAGGDSRGRQSAAVVATRVTDEREHPPLLDVDLRSDDHEAPVTELVRLLRAQAERR